MITVVGLGVREGDLTKSGEKAVLSAKKVLCRTANTVSYQNLVSLGVEVEALDKEYERSGSFASLTKNLCKAVLQAERTYGDVVYAVDGSASEDNSVKQIVKAKRGKVTLIGGVSKIVDIAERSQLSACSYTAVSAYDLQDVYANTELSSPLIVYDLDDRNFASDVKLLLSYCFGEETEVKFVNLQSVKKCKLYEIDRMKKYDYTTAVVVEGQTLLQKERFTLKDLESIIKRLRRPDGCPWDRVQTPESIKMNVIEEAYELLDAINKNDDDKVLEESGDLLMQVVFHAVMREETGAFNLGDVVKGVCDKLIFRHTHVFGNDHAKNDAEALDVWDKNKMKEKKQETYSDAVNDVPTCFPALMQAQKINKRIGKGSWKFSSLDDAKAKFVCEYTEFLEAYEQGDKVRAEREFGNMLMMATYLARETEIDAEQALYETVQRIKSRFTAFEEKVLADGKDVNSLTKEEWNAYYEAVKGITGENK